MTADAFHRLAEVPPEIEWFANLGKRSTRRAYGNAIRDFMRFAGIATPHRDVREAMTDSANAISVAWLKRARQCAPGG